MWYNYDFVTWPIGAEFAAWQDRNSVTTQEMNLLDWNVNKLENGKQKV